MKSLPRILMQKVEPLQTIETDHDDMIHDAQLDFYGRRLATCSTDKTVKIFDVVDGKKELIETLRGHDGPVWQVSWADPRVGPFLASCSADHSVIIWREDETGWIRVHRHENKDAGSMNVIAWAPYTEEQPQLAIGTSQGFIALLTLEETSWQYSTIAPPDMPAHINGVLGLSWAPPPVTLDGKAPKQIASCGCDNQVHVFEYSTGENGGIEWRHAFTLPEKHTDWVRDVAWAPQVGLANAVVATCGQDNSVFIYTNTTTGEWVAEELKDIPDDTPVWRVSWSLAGNVLAVSCGSAEGQVKLFKQSLDGSWNCIKTIENS